MSSKSSSFHSEGNSSTRDANISAYSDTESYSDYGDKGQNKELSLKTARSEGGGDLVVSLSTAYTEGTNGYIVVDFKECYIINALSLRSATPRRLPVQLMNSVGRLFNILSNVIENITAGALIASFTVLPEPVFSEYSLEPSETAVEFPEEDIQETETAKTARSVDGIVLPKPIYSEYSTEPSEMAIEFSDNSFDNSGIEDKCHSELSTAADGYDSRLATGHLLNLNVYIYFLFSDIHSSSLIENYTLIETYARRSQYFVKKRTERIVVGAHTLFLIDLS
uniref:Uncharacterized protein n=1 Tax=Ascaris lumbricoides TaxID=6252 RepID=A0A9J2Q801_ASCLU